MKPRENRGISTNVEVVLVIAIILVELGAFYLAFTSSSNSNASGSSTSISSSSFSTSTSVLSCTYTASYEEYPLCPAPLSVSGLHQLIDQPNTVFTNYHNGTIIVYYGHNPCVVESYVLPNKTLVIDYLGVTSTQTCE